MTLPPAVTILPFMANQKESQGLRQPKNGGKKLLQIREPVARKRDTRVLPPPNEDGKSQPYWPRTGAEMVNDRSEQMATEFRPDFGKRLHRRGWAPL